MEEISQFGKAGDTDPHHLIDWDGVKVQGRGGVPFATGVLWENDLDYPAAKALAASLVTEKPFRPFSADSLEEAKRLIRECGRTVCTLEPEAVGELASGLTELKEYARKLGRLS